MILLDSNILIELLRNRTPLAVRLGEQLSTYDSSTLCINPVVVAELLLPARDKTEFGFLKVMLSRYIFLPINETVVERAGTWIDTFALSHNPTYHDLLIGATAAVHGARLLTLNAKDLSYLPGVELEQAK